MRFPTIHVSLAVVSFVGASCLQNELYAAPSVAAAMKLQPVQKNVDYDVPEKSELEKCTITAERIGEHTGWVVRGAAGQTLRRFVDSKGNKVVDQWCYYKNGIEVYRDIDSDHDGKADQYRWLNTAGSRWAIDKDEDGKIDHWKSISAEEVSAEVVAALRAGDSARFANVLLTEDELTSLELGEKKTKQIAKKIDEAEATFKRIAARQNTVQANSQWVHFGANRPGVVPAGTEGSKKDLVVYENVVTMIETDKKVSDIRLGTLVHVENGWRMIDVPRLGDEDVASGQTGFFFQASLARVPDRPSNVPPASDAPSEELQELLDSLQKVENDLTRAKTAKEKESLHKRRLGVLKEIIASVDEDKEKAQWYRQLADTLSMAVQAGVYEDGAEELADIVAALKKNAEDDPDAADLASYAQYRLMTARYTIRLQEPEADYSKIQAKWLKELAGFVDEYPKTADAADAMIQLGLAAEFAGEEDKAKKWYARVVTIRPAEELTSKKASGAVRRLASPGKSISLRGKTVDGRSFNLAAFRGKVVVVNYWATWCGPCKKDMEVLAKLYTKYARHGLTVVSVSLDTDKTELRRYLSANRMPWVHLNEPAGLDGPLATQLGILTLPKMMLIDKRGRVANRDAHAGHLDAELKRLLTR